MSSTTRPALSRAAFATLLLIAFMMGANHVAARLAFDHGVTVATAVTFRSGVTALVVAAILIIYRVPLRLQAKHRKALPAIGNEFILLLKATSLVAVITVFDLMGQARFIFSETLDLRVYYIAALHYLVLVLAIEWALRRVERRFSWVQ